MGGLYYKELQINILEKAFFLPDPPCSQHSLGTKRDSAPSPGLSYPLLAWCIGKAQTLRPPFSTPHGPQWHLCTQEAGDSNIHDRPHCFSPGKIQAGGGPITDCALPPLRGLQMELRHPSGRHVAQQRLLFMDGPYFTGRGAQDRSHSLLQQPLSHPRSLCQTRDDALVLQGKPLTSSKDE